jgi:hypothetical protein
VLDLLVPKNRTLFQAVVGTQFHNLKNWLPGHETNQPPKNARLEDAGSYGDDISLNLVRERYGTGEFRLMTRIT